MALLSATPMAAPSLLQTKSQESISLSSQTPHIQTTDLTHGERIDCPFPTLTAAFYHHVQHYPDIVAARDLSLQPPRETTYAQLGMLSQSLARRLHNLGVRPGDRVPLVVTRSTEMLVGIFAILSCGAQYVPLDGGVVPDTTLQLVLKQTQAKVALCLRSTARRVTAMKDVQCQIVLIDIELELTVDDAQVATQRLDLASAESGCYVIYTSGTVSHHVDLLKCGSMLTKSLGTTGSPKGVSVTHGNVTNLICLSPGNLRIRLGTKVGQVLSISFDMGTLMTLPLDSEISAD